MKMQTTARDILEAHAALAAHGGLSLAPALSLRFARLTRAIRAEADTIAEARTALIEKHAQRDAQGRIVTIELPGGRTDTRLADPPAFRAAEKELLAAACDLPGEPFALAELGTQPIASDLLAGLHFAIRD